MNFLGVQNPPKLQNGNYKLLKVFKLKLNILSTLNEPSLAPNLRPDIGETWPYSKDAYPLLETYLPPC